MTSIMCLPLKAPLANDHADDVKKMILWHKPTSVGITEGYGTHTRGALSAVPGYRVIQENGGKDKRRGQWDNPILTASNRVSLGSGQIFGCHAAKPSKLAPERWLTFSAWMEGDRPICHINLHPHAGVMNPKTGEWIRKTEDDRQRLHGYFVQMRRFNNLLRFANAAGWCPVVTGDLNAWDKPSSHHAGNPFTIMRNHSLEIHQHGIIVLAADRGLKLKSVDEINLPNTISDHIGLIGNF